MLKPCERLLAGAAAIRAEWHISDADRPAVAGADRTADTARERPVRWSIVARTCCVAATDD